MYFSWEYRGVEPKTKAVPPSQAPSVHPSTSVFIGLGPVHIPDQAPIVVWVEPILPLTLGGKLTVNGLWNAYLSIILSDLICKMGSCPVS